MATPRRRRRNAQPLQMTMTGASDIRRDRGQRSPVRRPWDQRDDDVALERVSEGDEGRQFRIAGLEDMADRPVAAVATAAGERALGQAAPVHQPIELL